jgi:lactate dehydrogenase-like 2-hydroxyacid dehydrogenase
MTEPEVRALPTRPVIFVTRRLPEAVEARLARDYDVRWNTSDRVLEAADLIAEAAAVDGVLTCSTERWSEAVIGALPERLKIIATFSVGHDHIDVAAAERAGITVTNTPDVLTEATADIAMLCLLAASRRALESQAMLRRGDWRRWSPTELLGRGLQGQNLGIVGMGRIGRALATRARAFGLMIHYHNRSRLDPGLERGATYHKTLETMLPVSHFLSLHCPATRDNDNMLDASRLRLLPPGAVLVNTARGTLVDDDAVIAALAEGRLFAAGLDVFRNEPDLDRRYLDLPNAFLLPHIGSATLETRNEMGFRCLDNLDAHFAGRPVPNPVTG